MASEVWLGSRLLSEWRHREGLNQTEAARCLGVDQGRYSQFERGTRRPGLQRAIRIQDGTGGAVPVESWAIAIDQSRSSAPQMEQD